MYSIVTLDLIINSSDSTYSSVTACDEFVWDGISYNESGTYTNLYQNAIGCDSTHTLNLTINQTSYGDDQQIHCDQYTWIDGITYTSNNNTASFVLTNANNCDSIVTLDLIINSSDSTYSSVTACDEFVWDGISYNESGTYTNLYQNAIGCDSTHTLNILINNADSTFSSVTACDEFVWDGVSYKIMVHILIIIQIHLDVIVYIFLIYLLIK